MKRTICRLPGVGIVARIVQRSDLMYAGLVLDKPTLVLVRRGTKWYRSGGKELIVESGQVIAIGDSEAFDVINHPAADGIYEAECLYFDPEIVAQFNAPHIGDRYFQGAHLIRKPAPPFFEAFDRAVEAIVSREKLPHDVATARLHEVLAWLHHEGGAFGGLRSRSVVSRVRSLLSVDPRQDWLAPEVASRLGMSEATLRRRLASEGQSLTKLMADIRMCVALSLLQSTDRPISQIAFEVGYQSASRFAARFRQRFGHPPTEVRGEKGLVDRIGIEFDRR